MVALIRKNQTEVYASVVFADFANGKKSKIIAFDPEYKSLIYIDFWKLGRGNSRNVFIVDTDTSDWDAKEGYWWILEDETLNAIKKGKELDYEMLDFCKSLQKAVSIKEWNELTCEKDVENLLSCSLSFHDACVELIEKKNGEIFLDFNTYWGCHIHFRIPEKGSQLHIKEKDGSCGEIFDSNIFFCDGFVWWVNQYQVKSPTEIDDEDIWFKAAKMEWKVAIDPLE